eukprot:Skav208238  [mRNA]  locus=scaffold2601:217603:220423:- [translate_table: standard]
MPIVFVKIAEAAVVTRFEDGVNDVLRLPSGSIVQVDLHEEMSHFDLKVDPLLHKDLIDHATWLFNQRDQCSFQLLLVFPSLDIHGLPTPPKLCHALVGIRLLRLTELSVPG